MRPARPGDRWPRRRARAARPPGRPARELPAREPGARRRPRRARRAALAPAAAQGPRRGLAPAAVAPAASAGSGDARGPGAAPAGAAEPVWVDVEAAAQAVEAARAAGLQARWSVAREHAEAAVELLRPGLLPGADRPLPVPRVRLPLPHRGAGRPRQRRRGPARLRAATRAPAGRARRRPRRGPAGAAPPAALRRDGRVSARVPCRCSAGRPASAAVAAVGDLAAAVRRPVRGAGSAAEAHGVGRGGGRPSGAHRRGGRRGQEPAWFGSSPAKRPQAARWSPTARATSWCVRRTGRSWRRSTTSSG